MNRSVSRRRSTVLALGTLVALPFQAGDLEIDAAYTLIGQASDDDRLTESTTGSADLFLAWEPGAGRLEAYIEANTSLRGSGVATRLPRSNADAGTALDADRSGRVQLSELKYSRTWAESFALTVGLLDPTVYLDATRIDNDENVQFLGASFVNNPTVEFPDYTLGAVSRIPMLDGRGRLTLLLAGSNGLADNPERSYSELLNVTDSTKGVFAAIETAVTTRAAAVKAGLWIHSADHTTLDGSRDNAHNRGIYATVGKRWGQWGSNIRAGAANREVSLADLFMSVSLQREAGRRTFGIAAARSRISPRSPLSLPSGSSHMEAYVRFDLTGSLQLTPSIQYLVNGAYDMTGTALDDDVWVASLRLHHVFLPRKR